MTNPAIMDAVTRTLREMDIHRSITADYGYGYVANTILAAVTPLIRAAALEEAAVVAEDADLPVISLHIAAGIRALKEHP